VFSNLVDEAIIVELTFAVKKVKYNETIQRNVVLKLSRYGDIPPGGGCKPLADLSCVPLEAGQSQNNNLTAFNLKWCPFVV